MASKLLNDILEERMEVDPVVEWLLKEVKPQTNKILDKPSDCTQEDFVSYVLNFIHIEALSYEKYRETPKKIHIPKFTNKLEEARARRRQALLADPLCNGAPKQAMPKVEGKPVSPISPLYMHSVNNVAMASTSRERTITLGDFVSPGRISFKKTSNLSPTSCDDPRQSRRITPTNANFKRQISSENSFDFKSDKEYTSESPVSTELITEKLKNLKLVNNSTYSNHIEVSPNLTQATHCKELELLSSLYIHLIKKNLVLNVASELYFIITLLLSKHYNNDQYNSHLFSSVHDIVWFAVNCVKQIVDVGPVDNCDNIIINILDKSALRLLATNERIMNLNNSMAEKLGTFGENIPNERPKPLDETVINVCFDSDTDNRDHFPSDPSFNAFRKQRDMFYELLRIWETNHANDNWNFSVNMSEKIRSLLNMHIDAANFRHLSRLIKSQLLASSKRSQDESMPYTNPNFLTNLPNIDAEKLHRLRSRLVVKDTCNGINAAPSFPGIQEFYREFILHAHVHLFYVHLENVFIRELLQLNDNSLESDEDIYDSETRNRYCMTTRSLQILAKFIGLIESLPYISKVHTLSDKLIEDEIQSRSWMVPRIDLHSKLNHAMETGSLIIILPWMVEYLAMLDASTLRLPYYETLFEKLFQLFKSEHAIHKWSYVLIKCTLGWLFEQTNFPSEQFFKNFNRRFAKLERRHGLDNMEVIDINVIYTVCPYLKELKKLLQYNCNRNGTVTSKHITPVTSRDTRNGVIDEKKLRLQLAEAFLNSKPSSLRKTLEFVSERIASSVVKTICNTIVPNVKLSATKAQKALVAFHSEEDFQDADIQADLKGKLFTLISRHVESLQDQSETAMKEQLANKIRPAIEALLPVEELPQTITVCVQITTGKCEDRIKEWIHTHINFNIFKDLDANFERLSRIAQRERKYKENLSNLPVLARGDVEHIESDDDAGPIVCPSKLMTNLQRLNARLLTTTGASPQAIKMINDASRIFKHRADLNDQTWLNINRQLMDHLIILVAHQPDDVTDEVLDAFFNFWQEQKGPNIFTQLFNGIISVRNFLIFIAVAPFVLPKTWSLYSKILYRLIKDELVTIEDFETQCLTIFREDWDTKTLNYFCRCLESVVDMYGNKDQFATLLSFLADYCTDL